MALKGQVKDLSGGRYGKLTVLHLIRVEKTGESFWQCVCDCGGPVEKNRSQLVRSKGMNHACDNCPRFQVNKWGVDFTGQRFGALTVVRLSEKKWRGLDRMWECKCDCGGEVLRRTEYLKAVERPGCMSCANDRRPNRATHRALVGRSRKKNGWAGPAPRLYNIWMNMKMRCRNKNDRNWSRYGGRGITVCREWLDFAAFQGRALANGYNETLTIDRVDNDRGYMPSNCEWVTQVENTRRQWASKSPEERTAEGKRRLETARRRVRESVLAEAKVIHMDLGKHLPIELCWGGGSQCL